MDLADLGGPAVSGCGDDKVQVRDCGKDADLEKAAVTQAASVLELAVILALPPPHRRNQTAAFWQTGKEPESLA